MDSNRLKPRPFFASVLLLASVSGVFFMTPLPPQAFAKEPEAPQLGLPIRCFPGKDCWVVNYVDHDPSNGVRDYACGTATYNMPSKQGNRHQGTDIAIRDMGEMRRGVEVLAAAAGKVIVVRDGMKDVSVRKIGSEALKGKLCGNGVVIDHGGGWETQYCHMRRGSVAVRRGDVVKRRHKLGLVGHSGRAQFPHIHLSVRYKNKVIDPFVGLGRTDKCEEPARATIRTMNGIIIFLKVFLFIQIRSQHTCINGPLRVISGPSGLYHPNGRFRV